MRGVGPGIVVGSRSPVTSHVVRQDDDRATWCGFVGELVLGARAAAFNKGNANYLQVMSDYQRWVEESHPESYDEMFVRSSPTMLPESMELQSQMMAELLRHGSVTELTDGASGTR